MRSIPTSKKITQQKPSQRSRMPLQQSFEQSIQINASATAVERCITDLSLMHRWLNPSLRCEPVGEWSTDVGSRSRFMIQIPFFQPALNSVVTAREPGLVVWEFDGFFHGRDRWECHPNERGTYLLNRFEFEIPNSLIRFGFNTFAASWTQEDMQAQLRRLKRVAEELHQKLHT
jgi:hypothetical protein